MLNIESRDQSNSQVLGRLDLWIVATTPKRVNFKGSVAESHRLFV